MTQPKPGLRLRCGQCGTEIIVIKADGAWPTCCGDTMVDLSVTPDQASQRS
jgi:hypothetical protein